MANMEARSRWIEAAVCGNDLAREHFAQPFGSVVHHPAPGELVIQIHSPLNYSNVGAAGKALGLRPLGLSRSGVPRSTTGHRAPSALRRGTPCVPRRGY